MTLIRRGNTFWIDIRISGQRFRRSLHTTDKHLALYKYKEEEDRIIQEYSGKKISFDKFCSQYLEWAWSSKPASTLRESQRLEKIKEFFTGLGIVYLDDITPYHIEQLKAELKTRALSKSTIYQYLQILRRMFNKAIAWEVYNKPNPLKKIRFSRGQSKINPLSHSDIKKILSIAQEISRAPKNPLQKSLYDLILFAINTGMRRSEILYLKWKDIREDEIVVKGKGDKIREVPINATARDILDRQLPKSKYIFDIPNRHQQDLFQWSMKKIGEKIGRKIHFHLFRHFMATRLIEAGVDMITVAAILGHSKLTVSIGYMHTDKERKQKAVDTITDTPRR